MNKNSDAPQEKPWEQWIYGAEARAAALAAGRSDWQDVTGWPVHLEHAHDQAKRIAGLLHDALEAAQREELAALNALMANGAVQKRPLEPQPAEVVSTMEADPTELAIAAMDITCPACGAHPGNRCTYISQPGVPLRAPAIHRARLEAAQQRLAEERPTEPKLRAPHQHSNWQIRTAPDGSRYCAACGQTTQDAPKQPEDFLMEEAAAEATESFLQQLAEAHPMEEPRIRQQLADAIEVAQEESDVEAREAAASARAAAEARALKGAYDEGTGEHA